MQVFVVHHEYADALHSDYKLIGVFSSEAKARESITRLCTLPGFIDYPNNFVVEAVTVDADVWMANQGEC